MLTEHANFGAVTGADWRVLLGEAVKSSCACKPQLVLVDFGIELTFSKLAELAVEAHSAASCTTLLSAAWVYFRNLVDH